MLKSEFTLKSTDGVHELYCAEWRPDGDKKPRAVVVIVHGVAEHCLRYEGFARRLTAAGFAVAALDLPGHGRSITGEDDKGFFAESGGWDNAVADIYALCLYEKKRFQEVPCVLFGHSMGSFLAQTFATLHSDGIDALVLSGTGLMSPLLISAGRLVARRELRRSGARGRSALIAKLAFGGYNKKFKNPRTGFDWLSRDEAEVDKYIADPLCGFDMTNALFLDMLGGFKHNADKKNISRIRRSLPVYMMSGSCDPVGGMGRQVEKLASLYGKAGLDVTVRLYPQGRHELLNGPDREKVTDGLIEWFTGAVCGGKADAR